MIGFEDKKIGVSLKASGVALPLSSLNDYHFYIYKICGNKKQVVATYKKSNTGMFAITPDGTETNKGYVVFNRKQSGVEEGETIYLEVMVQFTAGSEFISLKQNKGKTGVFLATIEETANNGELQ